METAKPTPEDGNAFIGIALIVGLLAAIALGHYGISAYGRMQENREAAERQQVLEDAAWCVNHMLEPDCLSD